jgi:hypothetical protein
MISCFSPLKNMVVCSLSFFLALFFGCFLYGVYSWFWFFIFFSLGNLCSLLIFYFDCMAVKIGFANLCWMFLGGGYIGCFDLFALHLFYLLVIFCSCNPYLVFFLRFFFIVLFARFFVWGLFSCVSNFVGWAYVVLFCW